MPNFAAAVTRLFRREPAPAQRPRRPAPLRRFSVVVDGGSQALLAKSTNVYSAVILQEFTRDSKCIPYWYLQGRDTMRILNEARNDLPGWSWNIRTKRFVRTVESNLTDDLRARSSLAQTKLNAITRLLQGINDARLPVETGAASQHIVYASKRDEARRFKEASYDENRILEFPYVMQHADFAGVSFAQAADDILFKARLDDDILLRTEFLRLKYLKKLRDAGSAEEVSAIMTERLNDFYLTSQL